MNMLASLEEAFLAPNVDVSEDELDALHLIASNYTNHLLDIRESTEVPPSVTDDCLFAMAHWAALLEPLKSTHYFLAEAMEARDDASDLVIHSSEIQQACKSVLSQMFLISCNIYRLQDDLEQNPDLLNHMTSVMDKMFEEAGVPQGDIQLELFS
ncbi:hypothetical protein [Synechococcus sp. WH 8016]|uniref:hypothetical protein n=1 Tax=Synechococcus sp. WH 8016 TaxID=166318 RepID=UPI00022D8BDC|nr:hypothetical protein [Synechococcus sp. WH 8016]EHA63814.1 hypothetical protein Syn8016DRAFT_0856 [Synechococcus sp. WH 8016]